MKLRFNTATETRRSLARIANAVVNDELDPKKANSVVSAANVILSAIKTDELEKRITELEHNIEDCENEHAKH